MENSINCIDCKSDYCFGCKEQKKVKVETEVDAGADADADTSIIHWLIKFVIFYLMMRSIGWLN